MNLEHKVVIITGSSSGIGQHLAIRFAQEGAKVVINYKKNAKGAKNTLTAIKKLGQEGLIVQADVSLPEDIEKLFSTVIDHFGIIDILINNAAIGTDNAPFMQAQFEDFTEMINTNLIGPMICSQYVIKIMQKQGYGKILFTSSVRGIEYGGRSPVYAATKAAINNFTKTLAKKVAPHIHVNAVAPAAVKTKTFDTWEHELVQSIINMQYIKRFISKDEISDAFIFLAKNDAMTGQVIYVDGGFTLK